MTVLALIGLVALCVALAATAAKYREAAQQWEDAGVEWAKAARMTLRLTRPVPVLPVDDGDVAAQIHSHDGRVVALVRRNGSITPPPRPQYRTPK